MPVTAIFLIGLGAACAMRPAAASHAICKGFVSERGGRADAFCAVAAVLCASHGADLVACGVGARALACAGCDVSALERSDLCGDFASCSAARAACASPDFECDDRGVHRCGTCFGTAAAIANTSTSWVAAAARRHGQLRAGTPGPPPSGAPPCAGESGECGGVGAIRTLSTACPPRATCAAAQAGCDGGSGFSCDEDERSYSCGTCSGAVGCARVSVTQGAECPQLERHCSAAYDSALVAADVKSGRGTYRCEACSPAGEVVPGGGLVTEGAPAARLQDVPALMWAALGGGIALLTAVKLLSGVGVAALTGPSPAKQANVVLRPLMAGTGCWRYDWDQHRWRALTVLERLVGMHELLGVCFAPRGVSARSMAAAKLLRSLLLSLGLAAAFSSWSVEHTMHYSDCVRSGGTTEASHSSSYGGLDVKLSFTPEVALVQVAVLTALGQLDAIVRNALIRNAHGKLAWVTPTVPLVVSVALGVGGLAGGIVFNRMHSQDPSDSQRTSQEVSMIISVVLSTKVLSWVGRDIVVVLLVHLLAVLTQAYAASDAAGPDPDRAAQGQALTPKEDWVYNPTPLQVQLAPTQQGARAPGKV